MRINRMFAIVPLLGALVACGGGEAEQSATLPVRSFQDDLELAISAPSRLQPVSPAELGVEESQEAEVEAPVASAPAPSRPVASAPSRSSSSSAGTYEAPAPAPRTEVVRNTKRDAAIGAGAGAVIGAVAGGSQNRVRGAVIGAVAGGAIGAVIGHTVDTDTRTVYEFN